jgi:hypothetical protein
LLTSSVSFSSLDELSAFLAIAFLVDFSEPVVMIFNLRISSLSWFVEPFSIFPDETKQKSSFRSTTRIASDQSAFDLLINAQGSLKKCENLGGLRARPTRSGIVPPLAGSTFGGNNNDLARVGGAPSPARTTFSELSLSLFDN